MSTNHSPKAGSCLMRSSTVSMASCVNLTPVDTGDRLYRGACVIRVAFVGVGLPQRSTGCTDARCETGDRFGAS